MATHNRAGEITYKQLDELTFEVTITTYTKTSSAQADRDSLNLCWGDGFCEWVLRNNGPIVGGNHKGEPLPNDIKRNTYSSIHTYPGRYTYIVSMTDPNRNGDILNVNFPNSIQIPFHLATKIVILNSQFQGTNDSPILLEPPIDNGNVGQPFIHIPNAFDTEGDSLNFEFIVPRKDTFTDVDDYKWPDEIIPGPMNQIFLDEKTGEFQWFNPQKKGEYNIAFLITEYRSGLPISCIIRDMQITILEEDNRPPEIEVIEEICVVAGDTIDFDVIASDPDSGQLVRLTTTGGPYQVTPSPAVFTVAPGYQPSPLTGNFYWETTCEHIQDQYYQVVFKAEDNYTTASGDSAILSTQKTVRIKVVGPPPENPVATGGNGIITVCWDKPYACEYLGLEFRGFSVWRKECGTTFTPDTCETGLSGRGFTKIADTLTVGQGSSYCFVDSDVERGRCYCYRILGNFAEINPAGFPYNFSESIASEETCVQLARDLPILTNVSVDVTDFNNGEMFVQWSKPKGEDLDTILNPGPYTYDVWRSQGFNSNNPVKVFTTTAPTFWQANDTSFVDTGLNTETFPYTYEVALWVNGNDSLGISLPGSSVFLEVASSDEINMLSWNENVRWVNSDYVIWKRDNTTTIYNPIDTVQVQFYDDEGLLNGVEYCYYIESIGTYGIPGIIDPILNLSQRACGTPLDTIPPCPPVLEVTNDCPTADDSAVESSFANYLTWTNPNNSCADDVVGYNVYYAENANSPYQIVETITVPDDTTWTHTIGFTVAGCYAVTAIDSVGNESEYSNVVCMDNCPIYNLPNVFTPNGDGANDLFIPFPYRFIDRIDLRIFNRHGQLVHETTDPDINWDGTNLNGKPLAAGVYYYHCYVYEDRLDGVLKRPDQLSGFIHIIYGKE